MQARTASSLVRIPAAACSHTAAQGSPGSCLSVCIAQPRSPSNFRWLGQLATPPCFHGARGTMRGLDPCT